jgi:hypothetical protein
MVRSSVSTVSTDLGHDPELREMRPDRVDQSGSLTAEHLAGSVQNEHTLLLKRTYRSTTLDRLGLARAILREFSSFAEMPRLSGWHSSRLAAPCNYRLNSLAPSVSRFFQRVISALAASILLLPTV